jgi:DNA gyrase subunit A
MDRYWESDDGYHVGSRLIRTDWGVVEHVTIGRMGLVGGDIPWAVKQEIKEEKVYAVINRFGYIKLLDTATYERNKENVAKDYRYIVEVMNTGKIYVFTDEGKCHQIKALAIPTGKYNDKGVPVESVSGMSSAETIINAVSDISPKEKLIFATEHGFVKKVALSEFESSRKMIDATKLTDGDRVVLVSPLKDNTTVVLVTEQKYCVAFDVAGISLLKRNSVGVTGIKTSADDKVTGALILGSETAFVIDGKEYSVAKAGKRGSRGKLLE